MGLSSLRSLICAGVQSVKANVEQNWALPPLGRDNEGRREERDRDSGISSLPSEDKLLARNLVRHRAWIKTRVRWVTTEDKRTFILGCDFF